MWARTANRTQDMYWHEEFGARFTWHLTAPGNPTEALCNRSYRALTMSQEEVPTDDSDNKVCLNCRKRLVVAQR